MVLTQTSPQLHFLKQLMAALSCAPWVRADRTCCALCNKLLPLLCSVVVRCVFGG